MSTPIEGTTAIMGSGQGLPLAILALCIGVIFYQSHQLGLSSKVWDTRRSHGNANTHTAKPNPWSLTTAAAAYRHYQASADAEATRMRGSFAKLTAAQVDLASTTAKEYEAKLIRLKEATSTNGEVANAIADLAIRELGVNASAIESVGAGSLFRTRETLLHFVRDWSEEGASERNVIFEPILDILRDAPEGARGEMKVLIPGSGLARLAWEISQLGYRATANELSWYMNLGLRFLIHPSATSSTHQHTIRPFSHRFSNQRSNQHLFRPVTFPDVLPRYSSHFQIAEGDFLKHKPAQGERYDFIVTQFFIDTGSNIVSTLQQISNLLKPGGKWINLGPLLWAGGASVSMELSLEEVLSLAKEIGFEIIGEGRGEVKEKYKRRTVECEYTADKMGTFQRIYHAEFWVATKSA